MISAVKLKHKIRQRHKGEASKNQTASSQKNDKGLNSESQRDGRSIPLGRRLVDLPRPPERRRNEQPRPPGRRRAEDSVIPGRDLPVEPLRRQFIIYNGNTQRKRPLVKQKGNHRDTRVERPQNHRGARADDRDNNRCVKDQGKSKHNILLNRTAKNIAQSGLEKGNKFYRGINKHRPSRKRTEWQARSTRYEVNNRLGNIEKSLKDLAITTRHEVHTRLRKIEISLRDMTSWKGRHAPIKRISDTENSRKSYMQYKVKSHKTMNDKRQQDRGKGHSEWKRFSKNQQKQKRKNVNVTVTHRNKERVPVQRKYNRRSKIRSRRVAPHDDDDEDDTGSIHVPTEHPIKKIEDMHFCVFEDTSINVKRTPRLKTTIDTTVEGDLCPPDLRGIVVLVVNNMPTVVVTDWANRSIKSFYSKNNQTCYSLIKLDDSPWGLKKLRDNMVGVTVPKSQHVMTFEVNPDLVLLSTIRTSKKYWGIAVMTSSTLVVGSSKPASLDILDMEGNVLQSFSNFTADCSVVNPDCLHVTKNGNILLSDSGNRSVVCVTSTGDIIFTYTSSMDRPLLYPSGVVSTSTGDILLADSAANKVMHLQESGTLVKDVLGLHHSRPNIEKPFGLCVSGNDLFIATRCSKVQVFSFV